MGEAEQGASSRPVAVRRNEASVEIGASAATVMAVITDVDAYPDWAEAITRADVLDFTADAFGDDLPARVRLTFEAGPVTDACTVRFTWPDERTVRCRLEPGGEGRLIVGFAGEMALEPLGDDTTTVTYSLGVDLVEPFASVRSDAAEAIIDGALAGLKSRVEG